MATRLTLDRLIELMIPEVQRIFLEVMQDIVDQAVIDQIVEAIENNDPEAAFRAIGFNGAALAPFLDAIDRAYKEAGIISAQDLGRIRTPTGLVVFRFDARNPAAEREIREHSSALVTRLTDEARENVRVTLERGMLAGTNPRVTALDLVGRIDPTSKKRVGGVIGLTNQQEAWVANVRRELETLDPKYLNKGLRDARYDSLVQKAIDSGEPLTRKQIDQLVTLYKNRTLKYRADVISQTETIQGINRADFRAHEQAVEEGLIRRDAILKYWDDAGDNRVRHSHRALAEKYKKGIPLDEPYVSPDTGARMMFPGDTSLGAPAGEIVACRCKNKIKVDFTVGVE